MNEKNNKAINQMVLAIKPGTPKQRLHIKNKHNFFFRELCDRLVNRVIQQKPIRDDTLLNFNKTVVSLIENNISAKVTPFEELSHLICEYMRYGFADDSDKQRAYSYLRLSQMIDTFRIFHEERNIEIKAHQEATEHPEFAEIIREFKHEDRITYKLSKRTDKSIEKSLLDLVKRGFVIECGIKNDKYYILSKTGDALFRNLCFDGDYDWVDRWSDKRIFVFSQCLLLLNKIKSDIAVKDVTRAFTEFSEEDIDGLFEKIKLNINTKKASPFLASDIPKSMFLDPYITEDTMQKNIYFDIDSTESGWPFKKSS